jgi:sugar phosphate isomerase/epimerase
MKRGVQALTVRMFLADKAQCRETYKKIADIGYDSVQAGTSAGMTPVELKEILDEFGLTNCSSGGNYKRMLEDDSAIVDAVNGAKLFGTRYLSVGTIPEEFRYSQDGIKRYAQSLNTIAAKVKKEGCALLYHHHALEFYSFGNGLNGMDVFLAETDPDGVHFTMDTHWLISAGVDPVMWIRKAKGRMTVIHFKDYAITTGAKAVEDVFKTFAEIGEGNINWPPIVDACREIGVEYIIVEQDVCKGDPFDSLKTSFKCLQKLGV